MMKIVLLLACVVCVSCSTLRDRKEKRELLEEIVIELESVLKHPQMETKGKEVFLPELKSDGCKPEYFCQAEDLLMKKVAVLSGSFFDHFRADKKPLRILDQYNKLYGVKTCSPANDQHEITLDDFLKKVLSCVRQENSRK